MCVEKPPPVTDPNVHLCVCREEGGKCDSVSRFRSAVLLNYLSAFYSEAPIPLFPSLSQAKHLSFHSWVNLYSIEMGSWWQRGEGGEWVQSPHSGLLFSIPLLGYSTQQAGNTENQSLSTAA